MLSCRQLSQQLSQGRLDARLDALYCCRGSEEALAPRRTRAIQCVEAFSRLYPHAPSACLFSAPGRTELGGNHTDHQRGHILAASVDLDMLSCAAPNGTSAVHITSEGYPPLTVDLSSLSPRPEERETSQALVRGIAARMAALGKTVSGFDAYITSAVPAGSGLSSSAAYEVLIGVICNTFFCRDCFSPLQLAQMGQFAENNYFGKPSGLMDQAACAVGGVLTADFASPEAPVVEQLPFDFSGSGHTLCIVSAGDSHADLTEDYAAIPREMHAAAAFFGKEVLRDVEEETFRARLPQLRAAVGDRAVLRALHFFDDDRRAQQEAQALRQGDLPRFLALMRASGLSSSLCLQNAYPISHPGQQAIPLALYAAEEVLQGRGGLRLHGGGFAGTIQAFVPDPLLPAFRAHMDLLLGEGACHILSIRPQGGCKL